MMPVIVFSSFFLQKKYLIQISLRKAIKIIYENGIIFFWSETSNRFQMWCEQWHLIRVFVRREKKKNENANSVK